MQKIEMEVFDAGRFLSLAVDAEKIHMNEEQFRFIRGIASISDKMWTDCEQWMIFDSDIFINEQEEGASRNIVFEMFGPEVLGMELPFIFRKQTVLHNPPEEIGNCMQTCIAGLLGKTINEVPHFGAGLTFDRSTPEIREKEGVEFMARVNEYLKSINYRLFEVLFNTNMKGLPDVLKGYGEIPLLVAGSSSRDTNHSVIMYKGKTYDPHPDNNGLTGPMDNGYFSVAVLVKIPGYFAEEI